MSAETPCGPRCGTLGQYVRNNKQGRSCAICRRNKAAYERFRRTSAFGLRKQAQGLARYLVIVSGVEENKTIVEIAQALGESPSTTSKTMKKYCLSRPPRLPECGTLRSYRSGCRCDDCRAANAAHVRKYRPHTSPSSDQTSSQS